MYEINYWVLYVYQIMTKKVSSHIWHMCANIIRFIYHTGDAHRLDLGGVHQLGAKCPTKLLGTVAATAGAC